MESATADEHEDKALCHHDHRKELIVQAARAVGVTRGNLSKLHHAPLTPKTHSLRPIKRTNDSGCYSCPQDQMLWREDVEHRPVELLRFYPPSAENVSTNAIENLMYNGKLLLDFRGTCQRFSKPTVGHFKHG